MVIEILGMGFLTFGGWFNGGSTFLGKAIQGFTVLTFLRKGEDLASV